MVLHSSFVKKLVATALLLCCASGQSQSVEEISAADGLDFDDKQSCAVALCGPPPSTKTISPELKAAHTRIFDRELKSGLIRLMTLEDSNVDSIISAETLAPKLKKIPLNDKHLAIINFFWSFEQLSKLSTYFEYRSDGSILLKDNFAEGLPGATTSELDMVKKTFTLSQSEAVKLSRSLEQLDLDSAIVEVYGSRVAESSLEKVKNDVFREILDKYIRLTQILPEFALKVPKVAYDLAAGVPANGGQLKLFRSSLPKLVLLDVIEHRSLYVKRPVNVAALVDERLASYQFQSLKQSRASRQSLKDSMLSFCNDTLSQRLAVHLNAEKVERARVASEQVRNSTERVVREIFNYDPRMREYFVSSVRKARFVFPKSASTLIFELRSEIANNIREIRAQMNSRNELALLFELITIKGSQNYQAIQQMCQELPAGSFSDHAQSHIGLVSVSHESVEKLPVGRAIMAHEVGHLIQASLLLANKISSLISTVTPSDKLDMKKYDSLVACLAKKHGTQPGRADSTDEDFADWIEAKVIRDLEAQRIPVKNAGCALMGSDGLNYGAMTGISLKWPETMKAGHSSSLMRLLMIDLESGKKLPPICSDLLQKGLPREAGETCSL